MNLISIFSLLFQVSLYKFVRLAGDLLPAPLFVPYIEMLCGLSNSPQAAHHCFNLLKSTANGPLSWDHFFASVKQYYMDLRQDGANTGDTFNWYLIFFPCLFSSVQSQHRYSLHHWRICFCLFYDQTKSWLKKNPCFFHGDLLIKLMAIDLCSSCSWMMCIFLVHNAMYIICKLKSHLQFIAYFFFISQFLAESFL